MASIENLKASDGTGNANVATVQSSRSPGATTLIVDTVAGYNPAGFSGTMGTPHTFTDPITSETITVISEATAVDFTGHVDGSNLEIDTIAPGYTDAGSEVGDIIIVRPTTQYGDDLAAVLEVAHNDDGTLKDNAVDAGVIADNAIDSEALFTDNVDPVKRASELMFDHVASGCVLTGTGYGSTLAWSLTSGVVYIGGKRLTYAGGTGNVSSSKDTYFDLLDNGDGTAVLVNTGGNIVANNAASPALAANSVRIGIIQSGANIASVAAINQGQETKVLPIASSIPYAVTDSLGNLICPRDPARKLIGYREIRSNSSDFVAATAITGLSVPFISDGLRKTKIAFQGQAFAVNAAETITLVLLVDGAQVQADDFYVAATNGSAAPKIEVIGTFSAGTHTVTITGAAPSTGRIVASSTKPAYISVQPS